MALTDLDRQEARVEPPEAAGRPPAALRQRDAERYLGMGEDFLDEPSPVPRCDIRRPGAQRPVWVFRVVDLDEFLASRLLAPGMPSPW